MKSHDAQALRKVANWISRARAVSDDKPPGVRLMVGIDPERRIPKFEIEEVGRTEEGYPMFGCSYFGGPGEGSEPSGSDIGRPRNAFSGRFSKIHRRFP